MQETWVRSLGWENALEKGKDTHSGILAGEFHGLWSLKGWKDPLGKGKATHSSIPAWRSPWGHKELNTAERL